MPRRDGGRCERFAIGGHDAMGSEARQIDSHAQLNDLPVLLCELAPNRLQLGWVDGLQFGGERVAGELRRR